MNLTATGGRLWVAVPNANEIVRIDPATNSVVATLKLPYSPCAFLVADQSAVWSAGGGCADKVGRIDARTTTLTATVDEPHAVGLALAFGSLWAAVIDSANVDQIDPRTGRLIARLHIGGAPVRLGVGFGSIWVDLRRSQGVPRRHEFGQVLRSPRETQSRDDGGKHGDNEARSLHRAGGVSGCRCRRSRSARVCGPACRESEGRLSRGQDPDPLELGGSGRGGGSSVGD
jgi:hypothetical protein